MDYINALVETRKTTDIFAKKLVPLSDTKISVDLDSDSRVNDNESMFSRFKNYMSNAYSLTKEKLVRSSGGKDKETSAPIVFCYSLIYVYYDQYTYITGVLA